MNNWNIEACLRMISTLLLATTACLVRFDTQTKTLFFGLTREANFRDLNALYVVVWIDTAAAIYNFLQLSINYRWPGFRNGVSAPHRYLGWGVYLLDQAAVYVVFGANSAAVQASMLAVTGEKSLQWMKLCNKYTRFCTQIGGALVCGYVAVVLMAITSSISACAVFRICSSKIN